MKKKNYGYLFFILLLGILPVNVNAATVQYNVCYGDSGAYSVSYDDADIASSVDVKSYITLSAISSCVNSNNCTVDIRTGPASAGLSSFNTINLSFAATKLYNSCYYENDTIISCPGYDILDYYNVVDDYVLGVKDSLEINYGVTSNITFDFNESTGNFTVNIKDLYNGALKVRYVYGSRVSNIKDEKNASNFEGQFLSKNTSKGAYVISNVSSNTEIMLEFYLNNSSNCNGSYIGYISFTTPDSSSFKVSNPGTTEGTEAYNICSSVKSYVPEKMGTDDKKAFNELKTSYIYECYSNEKIEYSEKATIASIIRTKFENLKLMFPANYISAGTSGGNICTDEYSTEKITFSKTGSYWGMVCTEKYTASGDTAKLVKAGDGFEYAANYTITRTCEIIQINKPTKPPKCEYKISHSCSWPTKTGTGTGQDAGPTEEFDLCINNCDNGKYTQGCINACYQSVYKNNREISFIDQFSSTSKNVEAEFMATTYTGPNTNTGCTTDHGRSGKIVQHCEHGVCDRACFSTWCGNNGGSCTFYTTVTPSGCSDNPEQVYANALAASENELDKLKEEQSKTISTGSYIYQITDSYLTTSNNQPYVFTVDSATDPMVNIESEQKTVNKETKTNVALGATDVGNKYVNYNSSQTEVATIKVSLPLSYVNKITGEAVYTSKVNSTNLFSIDYKNNKLSSSGNSAFDVTKYYGQSDRKYYTNVWSDNLNVVFVDGKAQLLKISDYNINVHSSNVGSGNFASTIECYYGVYNNFYRNCDSNDLTCTPCDSNTEVCDGGIQYIYRPIDLDDVFPNRDPRWNWTGTLNSAENKSTGASAFASETYLKYDIDPVATTQDIESKGYSIYDVSVDSSEVDYEFVLTTENIRNIRKYNKSVRDYNGDGSNNYLDYNMSCYTNSSGKEICTSRFLDNINGNSGDESYDSFITYSVGGYGIDARKSIAGCNNAIGGTECDD